MAKQDTAK